MKIYTKTGDKGTTTLVGGQRISKSSCRIEAYGTLDELMAHIGYLHDMLPQNEPFMTLRQQLLEILSRVMDCAALMATTDLTIEKLPKVSPRHVDQLELWTDELLVDLPLLRNFTLPVGSTMVSAAHICRTVARRAERECVRVSETPNQEVAPEVMQYLNRLSDYLYALCRKLTALSAGQDTLYRPGER